MTREITRVNVFTAALESMGKGPFSIGEIPPTPELVIDTSTIRLEAKAKLTLVAPGEKAATGKSSMNSQMPR
jgi:hypothetical protein